MGWIDKWEKRKEFGRVKEKSKRKKSLVCIHTCFHYVKIQPMIVKRSIKRYEVWFLFLHLISTNSDNTDFFFVPRACIKFLLEHSVPVNGFNVCSSNGSSAT